jgi:hypothetical protein
MGKIYRIANRMLMSILFLGPRLGYPCSVHKNLTCLAACEERSDICLPSNTSFSGEKTEASFVGLLTLAAALISWRQTTVICG